MLNPQTTDSTIPEKVTQPAQTVLQHNGKDCCNKPEGCGNCMKGGMPLKKEMLSFMTLLLIGVTTVLAVLLVNEKRAKLSTVSAPAGENQPVAMQKYALPAVPSISEVIQLPDPKLKGALSVEAALQIRRSKRFYSEVPVTMQELSQVLWSAQGVTNELGNRTAPSAKGAYPFSIYVVVRNAENIKAGLYLYNPTDHTLGNLGLANAGEKLIAAGVQDNAQKAPVVMVLAASPAKMTSKFPDADPMPNVYLEAGHIGQNIYLQAESIKMATVVSGGFSKDKVAEAIGLDPVNQSVIYLVPFGHIGEAPAGDSEK